MIERNAVDQIKPILRNLVFQRVSVSSWMRERIRYLLGCDSCFGDEIYLQIALAHMQAYMEMGFCYTDNEDCFDEVLTRLNTCRELQFPRMLFPAKRIPVNKSRIKLAIGKWRPSRAHAITGIQLVSDIITKIKLHQEGYFEYYQHCAAGTPPEKCKVELFIGTKETYLYSGQKNIFYVFKNQ